MNIDELKRNLLRDQDFKMEYEKYDLAFEISQMVIEARIIKGITQKKLADLIGTKQSSISRLESGSFLPSLSFLEKIAKALKSKIRVSIELDKQMTIDSYETFSSSVDTVSNYGYPNFKNYIANDQVEFLSVISSGGFYDKTHMVSFM